MRNLPKNTKTVVRNYTNKQGQIVQRTYYYAPNTQNIPNKKGKIPKRIQIGKEEKVVEFNLSADVKKFGNTKLVVFNKKTNKFETTKAYESLMRDKSANKGRLSDIRSIIDEFVEGKSKAYKGTGSIEDRTELNYLTYKSATARLEKDSIRRMFANAGVSAEDAAADLGVNVSDLLNNSNWDGDTFSVTINGKTITGTFVMRYEGSVWA